MNGVSIRLASPDDIDELIEMRRQFTFEDGDRGEEAVRPEYEAECRAFLEDALASGRWHIWVALSGPKIVSHAFVALVDKVPRPVREKRRIAYLTNVYTRPDFRGQGTGGRLIRRAQRAAHEAGVELMVVWPSDESIAFYRREGFAASDEALIWPSE